MRDRGASEVERRAVRRMSVERIVAAALLLRGAFSDPSQLPLLLHRELARKSQLPPADDGRGAAALRAAAPSAGVLRAVRSAQARKRLKQEAIASLNLRSAPVDGLSFVNEGGEHLTRAQLSGTSRSWRCSTCSRTTACSSSARATAPSAARSSTIGRRAMSPSSPTRGCAALAANLAANDGCEKCEVFEGFASRRPLVLGLLDAASGYGARAQAPAAADAPAAPHGRGPRAPRRRHAPAVHRADRRLRGLPRHLPRREPAAARRPRTRRVRSRRPRRMRLCRDPTPAPRPRLRVRGRRRAERGGAGAARGDSMKTMLAYKILERTVYSS